MTHNTQEVAEGLYVETVDDVMQKLHMLCSPAAEVLSDGARVNCFIDSINQLSQALQTEKEKHNQQLLRQKDNNQSFIELIENAGKENNPLPIMDFSEQGFSNDYISQREILKALRVSK